MTRPQQPPPGLTVERTLDGVALTLPPPRPSMLVVAAAMSTIVVAVVLLGSASLLIEAAAPPGWAGSLTLLAFLGGYPALFALLLLAGHLTSRHTQRRQEHIHLDPHGIRIVRGDHTLRRAWSEVVAIDPDRGLICVSGFVPLASGQPRATRQWLRAVVVDAKRASAHGSAREIPPALRALRADAP